MSKYLTLLWARCCSQLGTRLSKTTLSLRQNYQRLLIHKLAKEPIGCHFSFRRESRVLAQRVSSTEWKRDSLWLERALRRWAFGKPGWLSSYAWRSVACWRKPASHVGTLLNWRLGTEGFPWPVTYWNIVIFNGVRFSRSNPHDGPWWEAACHLVLTSHHPSFKKSKRQKTKQNKTENKTNKRKKTPKKNTKKQTNSVSKLAKSS